MNFQIDVSSCTPTSDTAPPPHAAPSDVAELLRQILEVQREQLAYQRNAAAAHDMTARWRAFLSRWQNEFPDLSEQYGVMSVPKIVINDSVEFVGAQPESRFVAAIVKAVGKE